GPGTGKRSRTLGAVEVHKHFAFGAFGTQLMIEIHQQLVVALHEVNFDSLDSPLGVLIEGGPHLVGEGFPDYPKDYADVFLFGVPGQLLDVDFGNDVANVAKLVPTFIENDVVEMIFGGEVDVVLVSLRVDTGFEVDAVDIVVVPPVPGDFARFDPGSVAQL